MASGLHNSFHGFYQAFTERGIVNEILERSLEIDACIDSLSVFIVITENIPILDRILPFYADVIYESHSKGKLRCLIWNSRSQNKVDGFKKGVAEIEFSPEVSDIYYPGR